MGLVDRGTETVTVFPSIDGGDGYGTPTRAVSETGVTVERVIVLPGGGPESAAEGQEASARFSLIGRLPEIDGFDAFAEVEWQGRRHDVVGVPIRLTFPRKYAGLMFVTLQGR